MNESLALRVVRRYAATTRPHPLLEDTTINYGVEVYATIRKLFTKYSLIETATLYFGRKFLEIRKYQEAAKLIPEEISFRTAPSVVAAKKTLDTLVRSINQRFNGSKQQAALLVAMVLKPVTDRSDIVRKLESLAESPPEPSAANNTQAESTLLQIMRRPEIARAGQIVSAQILRDFRGMEADAALYFSYYILDEINFSSLARQVPRFSDELSEKSDEVDALSDLAADIASNLDWVSPDCIIVCVAALSILEKSGVRSLKPALDILVAGTINEIESLEASHSRKVLGVVAANGGPFEGRGWTEHKEWLNEARRSTPKPVSPARAREIMQQAKAMAEYGPWTDQLNRVMTQGEYKYINDFWETLPGNYSFSSALTELSRGV